MADYKARMQVIYSTCISTGILDEAPMAYKNPDEIVLAISPTAKIMDYLKPLYNFYIYSYSYLAIPVKYVL